MRQTVMTIIAGVKPGHADELASVIKTIAANPAGNEDLPLAALPMLHFASLVLHDDPELGPRLVFETNSDGSAGDLVSALVATARSGVEAVFGHCVGYPADAGDRAVLSYLHGHVVRPGAYHIGATGRSLARVRQEGRLRDAIQGFLDAGHMAGTTPPTRAELRASIQAFVRDNPEFDWAETCPPRETMLERARYYARAVASLPAAILLLPAAPVALITLVVKELTDRPRTDAPDPAHVRALSDAEDFGVANHLASVIPVKPGPFRLTTLRVVLYALNLIARLRANKGELGGITSIHFAHWSVIDGGRRLLFLSNYDGSWESYLNDFIDKAAIGLTAVWSNTVGFPRTRFLVFRGARDGPRFKHWARANQTPTAAWYRAYDGLTMATIENNSAIREGLFGSLDDDGIRQWLQRF